MKIPFCRSTFLQDVTIAIGRRRKRFSYSRCTFDVENTETDEGSLECLLMTAGHTYVRIWEDGRASVVFHVVPGKHEKAICWWFYPDISNFTPEGIAQAMRDTVAVPDSKEALCEIWEHEGEVEC